MLEKNKNIYKKAFVEVYTLLKLLPEEEYVKLPNDFLTNLQENMDKDYTFKLDEEKDLFEQDFLLETKALIVEIYERYLCPEDEKEKWKEYDKICFEKIEAEKSQEYNSEKMFKDKSSSEDILFPVEVKEKKLHEKFLDFLKKIFSRISSN